jgi:hypothetical protein
MTVEGGIFSYVKIDGYVADNYSPLYARELATVHSKSCIDPRA